MTQQETDAMEAARHELITLDGLIAADGVAPTETWVLDTKAIIKKLDAVLSATYESGT